MHACVNTRTCILTYLFGQLSSVEIVLLVTDHVSLLGNYEEKAGREWQEMTNW